MCAKNILSVIQRGEGMQLLFLIMFMASSTMANTQKDILQLRQKISSVLDTVQGTFAVAFKDLQTGQTLYINEHENFHAASTMKTPVMVEVFKQVKERKFSLDDSIEVRNSFRSIIDGSEYSLELSDDSDDGLYHYIGKKESIRNLVSKMITVSSNLATNLLIEKVGADNVMETMKKTGLHEIQVLRGVEDGKAFQAGKNNTVTAWDLALLFERIAKKQLVSPSACDSMINILLNQQFNTMIPAKLPSGVKIAHKTGSITNVQHDSGIIYLPDGRTYVLIILSKNLRSNSEGIEVIAELSKIIYEFVVG